MVKDFVYKSKYYLVALVVLLLIFFLCKIYFIEEIMVMDEAISAFVQERIVSEPWTFCFKIVTNAGGVIFFLVILFLVFLVFKNRSYFSGISFSLVLTYLVSVVFKNCFRRERPIYNLIDKPSDFSFPSGHTMCSVAFYGYIIYLLNVNVKNRVLRYFIQLLLVTLVSVIAFSRIYLNVHYFSDVVCGFVLGYVCLIMVINYVKISE